MGDFSSTGKRMQIFVGFSLLFCTALVSEAYKPESYPVDWNNVNTSGSNRNLNSPYLGECVCDVTWGLCDINCCCDSDCSSSTIALFKECLPETFGEPKLRYCYEYNDGTKLQRLNDVTGNILIDKVDQGTGAVCVVRANHPSSLYPFYSVPTSVGKPSVGANSWDYSLAGAGFRIGDPMMLLKYVTINAESVYRSVGIFQFPISDSRGACRIPGNGIPFLNPITRVSCALNGAQICEMFPISSFVNLFFYNHNSDAVDNTSVTPVNVKIFNSGGNLVEEITSGATPVNPSTQTTFNGGVCLNAVERVNVTLVYNTSSENTLVSALFELFISDVPGNSFVPLSFLSVFLQQNASVPNLFISGNPGYTTNSRVRAGTLLESEGKSAISEQKGGFILPSGGRSCEFKNFRGVNFMHSVLSSGCYETLSEQELIDICSSGSKNLILKALNVSSTSEIKLINRIAITNDALTNETSGWIEIDNYNFTVDPSLASYDYVQRKCSNVVVGVRYDFVVARAGVEYNPQEVIVGAFATPILGSWKIHNSDFSLTAQSKVQLRFEAHFSRYDPKSQDTIHRRVKAPPILPQLDDSIFYPFRKPYPL